MKTILSHNLPLDDKGQIGGLVAVEGSDLILEVNARYRHVQPIAPLVDKIMGPVDGLVDKLEALLPGDQKAMAQAAKVDVRKAILDILSEQVTPQVAEASTPNADVQV